MYLLDTNAWVAYLRQKNQALILRLTQHSPSDIVLCSVVLAELYFGVERSPDSHKDRNRSLVGDLCAQFASIPFDDRAAEIYGSIRAQLMSLGTPIGPNDLMIAAIALANDLTLVTHNTGEFGRISGLALDDWLSP